MNVAELLDQVDSIAPVLQENARASEDEGRLAKASVDALRETSLFGLLTPTEVGGCGVDLPGYVDVIEAVAAIETAAAWNLSIGAVTSAIVAAYLPDDALGDVFTGEVPIMAGQVAPMGKVVSQHGGAQLSGRWQFGSGISQAEWVVSGASLPGDPRRLALLLVPIADVDVVDGSWEVAGLSGTGSFDYQIDDVFVPESRFIDFPAPARRRGSAHFDLSIAAIVSVHHIGFALGAARRALNEIAEIAATKIRSFGTTSIGHRPTFQQALARHELALDAGGLLARDVLARAQADPGDAAVLECAAVARYVTDLAADAVTWAYHAGGGSALRLDSVLQRLQRDIHAGTQHAYIDESVYTNLGAALVGLNR